MISGGHPVRQLRLYYYSNLHFPTVGRDDPPISLLASPAFLILVEPILKTQKIYCWIRNPGDWVLRFPRSESRFLNTYHSHRRNMITNNRVKI